MAKSKSKKKSVAQNVVETAAIGLPPPVRAVVGSRWGSRLAVVVLLALLATGIATVDWTSGRPRLKIDRERAQEVRQEVREEVQALAGHESHEKPGKGIFGTPDAEKPKKSVFGIPVAEKPASDHHFFGGDTHKADAGPKQTIGARIFKDHK